MAVHDFPVVIMVFYVAFVAITNVCIGFAVGRMLHAPRKRYDEELWNTDIDDRGPGESNGNSEFAKEAAFEKIASDEPLGSHNPVIDSQSATHGPQTWLGEKCEFAVQLREVTERANYSRTARDKNLLRQAADQVLSCISGRYDELQNTLSGSDGNTLLVGDARDGVEMLSAQIETSISNLRALDWSAPVDDVGMRLDCELTLLNEQQRSLSSVLRNSKS